MPHEATVFHFVSIRFDSIRFVSFRFVSRKKKAERVRLRLAAAAARRDARTAASATAVSGLGAVDTEGDAEVRTCTFEPATVPPSALLIDVSKEDRIKRTIASKNDLPLEHAK